MQHLLNIQLIADFATFPFPHSFPRVISLQTQGLSVCRSVVPLGAECDPPHCGAETMPDYRVNEPAVSCTRWIIFSDLNVSHNEFPDSTPPGLRRLDAAGPTENKTPPSSRVLGIHAHTHTCTYIPSLPLTFFLACSVTSWAFFQAFSVALEACFPTPVKG